MACSYFQYEEFPGFMTFFYIVYFTFIILMTMMQARASSLGTGADRARLL